MKISYAIPVCNELSELERLLSFLVKHKRPQDEIVILYDSENGSKIVEQYLQSNHSMSHDYAWFTNPLNNDFAQQKNYLTKKCTGDWVFLIDADEYPDKLLCKCLSAMLESNPSVEAYWVPRINTVDGLTEQHIAKWGWKVNSEGWVNFPDSQLRIYKNDPDRIYWTKPVHEQLVGYNKYAVLPLDEEFCLHHPKDINRQEKQNNFYEKL